MESSKTKWLAAAFSVVIAALLGAFCMVAPAYADNEEPTAAGSSATEQVSDNLKGDWVKGAKGWWYKTSDTTWATGLQTINNKQYYFGTDGWMQTGWVKLDGVWYYFANSGAMMKSAWLKDGNSWYYLWDDGAMAVSENDINGKTYFMNPSGAMITGWKQLEGDWYYFNKKGDGTEGAMHKGWLKSGNTWYYLWTDTGIMATGLNEIPLKNGNYYYFASSGAMQTGWVKTGSDDTSDFWYYFNKKGQGTEGAAHLGWLKDGSDWYYLNPETKGLMVSNSYWMKIGGKTYTFEKSGAMVTGWWTPDKTAKVPVWFYYAASGAMQTNKWVKSGSDWYYLLSDGVMATSQWVGDCWVNAEGKWVPSKSPVVAAVVSFDANGGTGKVASVNTSIGQEITLPEADGMTKKNCTFAGWKNSPKASVVYQPGDTFKVTEASVTLYADWTDDEPVAEK